MIEAEWWEYDDADEMAEAVAGDIGFIIESALDARGSSLVALPGGESARPILKALAARKLPWKQVTIIPTDERLVPMDDERSNVRALAQAFLPAGARVIPITADIPDYRLAGNSADAPKARRAVGVMPDPLPEDAPVARVTLTRASILSARTVLITLTGADKREMLEGAIEDGQSSKLPIGRVLAEAEQPIDIHWAP
jgi:6-phosphogluconolactonase